MPDKMYLQWKRAREEHTCKHCEVKIPPGTLYLFSRTSGDGHRCIDEAICEPCGDKYPATSITIPKPEPREPRFKKPPIAPVIKYRAICPYCRKGQVVETIEQAHLWMETHIHGSFGYRWEQKDIHPENVSISLVKDRRFTYNHVEAKAALAASVLKWLDILNMEDFAMDAGHENCPLCGLYREHGCIRCPVFIQTGKKLCEGTPQRDWWTHHWLVHNQWHDLVLHPECPECRILANNELNFLISLLEGDSNASML